MKSVERILVLTSTGLLPLFFLRLPSVNITAGDVSLAFLWVYYLVVCRAIPKMPSAYWTCCLVFLVSSGFSVIFAIDALNSLTYYLEYLFIFIAAVPTAYMAVFRNNIKYICYGFLGAGLFIGIYTVMIYHSGAITYAAKGRYGGLFGNPQSFSFAIVSILPYLIYAAYKDSNERKYILALAAAVTVVTVTFSLLMSASRTGALACVVALVLSVCYARFASSKRRQSRSKPLFKIISVVLLLCVGVIFLGEYLHINGSVINELILRSNTKTISVQSVRYTDIIHALENINVRTFFLGVGLDNGGLLKNVSFRPHNVFLLFFLEGGILTFLAALALFFVAFRQILVARKGYKFVDRRLGYFLIASIAGVATFVVIGMFNTSGIERIYWWNYGALLGITGKCLQYERLCTRYK